MKSLILIAIIFTTLSAQSSFIEPANGGTDTKVSSKLIKECTDIFSKEKANACIGLVVLHSRVITTDLIRSCQRASIERSGNSFYMNEQKALDCIDEQATRINPDIKK